ncbi:MAG: hypothetical protein NVSMB14_12130 [Isosphaeraceae bacterium]
MNELAFYRQKRADGGVREGISIGETTLLGRFAPGTRPFDPSLLWYVDVRLEGSRLPNEPEEARGWFLQHAAPIKESLSLLAGELEAGLDLDLYPIDRPVRHLPRGVKGKIVCTAARRKHALAFARVLREMKDHWEERIESLEPLAISR